jgi:hypothetical protein
MKQDLMVIWCILITGVLGYNSYLITMNTLSVEVFTDMKLDSFSTFTNHSINAVYVPRPSIVIPMTRNNNDALKNLTSHEYMHYLIMSGEMCGNESCREHFCN